MKYFSRHSFLSPCSRNSPGAATKQQLQSDRSESEQVQINSRAREKQQDPMEQRWKQGEQGRAGCRQPGSHAHRRPASIQFTRDDVFILAAPSSSSRSMCSLRSHSYCFFWHHRSVLWFLCCSSVRETLSHQSLLLLLVPVPQEIQACTWLGLLLGLNMSSTLGQKFSVELVATEHGAFDWFLIEPELKVHRLREGTIACNLNERNNGLPCLSVQAGVPRDTQIEITFMLCQISSHSSS